MSSASVVTLTDRKCHPSRLTSPWDVIVRIVIVRIVIALFTRKPSGPDYHRSQAGSLIVELFRSLAARMSIVVFLALLLGIAGGFPADLGAEPPQLEKPKGEQCIRPTDWMRRNHMDFLKHKRTLTVREGVRVRSESLLKCAECHTSHNRFCDRCHDYVAVEPDCFECHLFPK